MISGTASTPTVTWYHARPRAIDVTVHREDYIDCWTHEPLSAV